MMRFMASDIRSRRLAFWSAAVLGLVLIEAGLASVLITGKAEGNLALVVAGAVQLALLRWRRGVAFGVAGTSFFLLALLMVPVFSSSAESPRQLVDDVVLAWVACVICAAALLALAGLCLAESRRDRIAAGHAVVRRPAGGWSAPWAR